MFMESYGGPDLNDKDPRRKRLGSALSRVSVANGNKEK